MEIDGLLPLGFNARRGEIELFDPGDYLRRETPPFVEHFIRAAPLGSVVAADADAYVAWFEPLLDAHRSQRVLHIFMVNRCGSTALLNALSRHPQVAAFNELDPWILDAEPTEAALAARIDLAFGAHVRQWSATTGRVPLLKHRGETLLAAPTMLAGFPTARALFLIRHYDHVIGSHLARLPRSFPGAVVRAIERVAPSAQRWDPQLATRLLAAFYLDTVDRYRALAVAHDVRCVRYETFVRAPDAVLRAIARWFELDVDDTLVAAMLGELAFDAKRRSAGETIEFANRPSHRPELDAPTRDALERAWTTPLPNEIV